MSKRTLKTEEGPASDIDAAWAAHIEAKAVAEYDKAAGWLSVVDFAHKCNTSEQSASLYLKNGYRNGQLERREIMINNRRGFIYRPKVKV